MTEPDTIDLTIFQQALWIIARWPGPVRVTQHTRDGGLADRIHWTGQLQPTSLSVTYAVEVTYGDGERFPTIQVLNPPLDPGHATELPHVYTASGDLCLHELNEWDPTQPIAVTTIPWTAEWLLHYELWQATGDWTGGGDSYSMPVRPVDGRRAGPAPDPPRRARTKKRLRAGTRARP